jgi:ABC-type transport system involved in cytochrome bd biosynthesis fused ATPase/permease subunit
MESMRSTWTDSRLDELNARVGEMDTRLTGRIDSLQHVMVQAFIALVVIMVTGFMGLAGLIITQI